MKENNSLIIKKESWIKNIINKIKKVFFKNEKNQIQKNCPETSFPAFF